MKLQFSLATLLVCVTALAVVGGIAVEVPVRRIFCYEPVAGPGPTEFIDYKPPTASEIAQRLELWWPASIAVTLGVLWAVRGFPHQPTKPRAV